MNHTEYLKDKIKQIPELPGIYKMLDANHRIIYIGKSKCLKKRVQSYFTASPKWEKVTRMVTLIRDIEYVVTDTHLEARLLECTLIKDIQPHFNAQMKNDQRYIYIKVDTYNPFRSLSVVTTREKDCYGPFRSKYSISQFLGMLKNLYPIKKTENSYELEYHMFPEKLDQEAFDRNRTILLELFDHPEYITALIAVLQAKLEEEAANYRFEMAAIYRDVMKGFYTIKYGLEGYRSLITKNIIVKLPISQGFKLFYVSDGTILFQKIVTDLTDQVIASFHREALKQPVSAKAEFLDEKSSIDFRDTLYSEISDLTDDMVMILSE